MIQVRLSPVNYRATIMIIISRRGLRCGKKNY